MSVSSRGHLFSPVVFEDINFDRREYTPFGAYGQSKTANVLFAVGANDPIVPKNESDQLADALTRNQIPHTYLAYSGEGHGLSMPANRLHFYALAEQFLAKHLDGRAQPLDDQPIPAGVTTLNDASKADPAAR